jgi:hypothetical protein
MMINQNKHNCSSTEALPLVSALGQSQLSLIGTSTIMKGVESSIDTSDINSSNRRVRDWNHMLSTKLAPRTQICYKKHVKDFMKHHALDAFGFGRIKDYN